MAEDEELKTVSENNEEEVTETSEPEIIEGEAGTLPEEPKETGIQKRINALTAEKYEQKRRADALAQELEQLKTVPVADVTEAPTLEKFDYDDAAFNKASIAYEVKKAVDQSNVDQQTRDIQTQRNVVNQEFARKITASGIEDYSTVIGNLVQSVPLSEGLVNAIQQDDKGPELAYYLGKHLDVADRLAGIDPITAALELGKISAGLSGKKIKTASNAPTPVKTVGGGGDIQNKNYEDMSMEEIYALP